MMIAKVRPDENAHGIGIKTKWYIYCENISVDLGLRSPVPPNKQFMDKKRPTLRVTRLFPKGGMFPPDALIRYRVRAILGRI